MSAWGAQTWGAGSWGRAVALFDVTVGDATQALDFSTDARMLARISATEAAQTQDFYTAARTLASAGVSEGLQAQVLYTAARTLVPASSVEGLQVQETLAYVYTPSSGWGAPAWGIDAWGGAARLLYATIADGVLQSNALQSVSVGVPTVVFEGVQAVALFAFVYVPAEGWGASGWGFEPWGGGAAIRFAVVAENAQRAIFAAPQVVAAPFVLETVSRTIAQATQQLLQAQAFDALAMAVRYAATSDSAFDLFVQEGAALSQALFCKRLWDAVQDEQSVFWAPVEDAQSGAWGLVQGGPGARWLPVVKRPDGAWVPVVDAQVPGWQNTRIIT